MAGLFILFVIVIALFELARGYIINIKKYP